MKDRDRLRSAEMQASLAPAQAPGYDKTGLIFSYELDVDVSQPIRTYTEAAELKGRFRHLNADEIELKPGVRGAFNLGVRLYRAEQSTLIFEDRMTADNHPIPPAVWTRVAVRIPRNLINFQDRFVLVFDMVKEEEYWFESFGRTPVAMELSFADMSAIARKQAPTVSPVPFPDDRRFGFKYATDTSAPATIQDVVTAFDLLLGRNPENAAIIRAKMSEGLPSMIEGIIDSDEFRERMAEPIRNGQAVMRGDYQGKPSGDALSWLFRHIDFDAEQRLALSSAANWHDFFVAFLAGRVSNARAEDGREAPRLLAMTDSPAGELEVAGGLAGLSPRDNGIGRLLDKIEDVRAFLTEIENVLRAVRD